VRRISESRPITGSNLPCKIRPNKHAVQATDKERADGIIKMGSCFEEYPEMCELTSRVRSIVELSFTKALCWI